MIRDQGPIYNLGFGANSRSLPRWDGVKEIEGTNPNSGIVSKALDKHPVMRFLAASAATVVVAGLASQVIRGKGMQLFSKLENIEKPWATQAITDIKKLRDHLDAFQGVVRTYENEAPLDGQLFARRLDGSLDPGKLTSNRSFFITRSEQMAEIQTGRPSLATYSMRDRIQQRLVASARSMPYQLPAFYVAQRAVVDPLMGTGEKGDKKVNWFNPVDVVTDFVNQSAKNAMFMMLPFEAGTAASKQGWERFLTYGDDLAVMTDKQRALKNGQLTLKAILSQVGTEASDLTARAMNFSSRTTGALATGLNEARESGVGLVQYLHRVRSGFANQGVVNSIKNARSNLTASELLDITPGPFKGFGTGLKAGIQKYQQMYASQQAYNDMLSMGRANFEKNVGGQKLTSAHQTFLSKKLHPQWQATDVGKELGSVTGFNTQLEAAQAQLGRGSHTIESFARKYRTYGRGSGSSTRGKFFDMGSDGAYKNIIERQLVSQGIDPKAANKFVTEWEIAAPRFSSQGKQSETLLTERLRLAGKENGYIVRDSETAFFDSIQKVLNKRVGENSADSIRRNLSSVIEKADAQFMDKGFQRALDRRLANQWDVVKKQILPKGIEGQLKPIVQPFEKFAKANLSSDEISFLHRKTAQLTGLQMVSENGLPVSQNTVLDHLRKIKINPNDHAVMRGMLMDSGAIAKPWSVGGRNIFGLKPLTIDSALSKGMFKSGQYEENDIRSLVGRVAANDPVSTMGSYGLKGVWESNTGRVLDTTILKRGFNRFLNRAATEAQIPIVKFNPLEMGGYSAQQELRDKAIFQILPGKTNQPFLSKAVPGQGQVNGTDPDFYLWMKSGGRGSKGNVFTLGYNNQGTVVNQLKGVYRPQSATAGIVAKHAKLAIQDEGRVPMGDGVKTRLVKKYDKTFGDGSWEKARQFFAASDNQQDSIFGHLSRFRNRKFDINNRTTFARLLRDGEMVQKDGSILTLEDLMKSDPARINQAAERFFGGLSKSRINTNIIKGLEDTELGKALQYDFTDVESAVTLPRRVVKISELKTPEQMEEFGRLVLEADKQAISSGAYRGLDDASRKAIGRSGRFIERTLQESYGGTYYDKTVGGGIGTRADALKSDLVRYLTVRQNALSQGEFNRQIPEFLERIGQMRTTGAISQAQATEAKAAFLSIQYDIGAVQTATTTQRVQALMTNDASAASRSVLDDLASGKGGSRSDASFSAFRPWFSKKFGYASYQYKGVEVNPFGSTDTVLMPTFGSTFSQSPMNAIKSVIGLNNYSNPQSFSATSAISSHIVERMNRPFGSLGLGLDPTKFKGSLDLYARGMVGKRVLPIVAGATTAVALDRTLGGLVNPKDDYGKRVYSPFFLGLAADIGVNASAIGAGLVPGGDTIQGQKDKLATEDVAVRAGRYWPLGNTPFKGGRIQYFRPSWYKRLKSGYSYTDQGYKTPLEKLAFGYDFSPLRPLDPYRFERKHYYDRPYPTTGPYFTGPWGPLTSALNMTVGKVLKPNRKMHEEEVNYGLGQYAAVGDTGAYIPPTTSFDVSKIGSKYSQNLNVIGSRGSGSAVLASGASGYVSGKGNYSPGPIRQPAMIGATSGGSSSASGIIGSYNSKLALAGKTSPATASNMAADRLSAINAKYADAAYSPSYGSVKRPGMMDPRIIAAAPPISTKSLSFQASQLGYQAQEFAGIYGFAFGALRTGLGFGNQNMATHKPVLASADKGYGSTRAFWDLNLGGLGDTPLPIDGNMSNFEFSEIARRFIPKERSEIQYLNPIKNDLGILYPWLPGSDYYINFKQGDPYTSVPEGEMRLPGAGYDRLHKLNSDKYGKYGLVDQHRILGDVAPWSQEYRQVDAMVNKMHLGGRQFETVANTRSQVAQKAVQKEFSPYKYKYESLQDALGTTAEKPASISSRIWERISHADTYLNTKFLPKRTAVEDWERNNVYGATFPEWQTPIKSFIEPMISKATQRGPFGGASSMGFVGALFGASPQARTVGAFIGGSVGLGAGLYGKAYEMFTGKQYMPARRKKEVALEEYTDILNYTKNMHLAASAKSSGDMELAQQFIQQAKKTMYGADIYQGNLAQISSAIPKRKREHFRAMLNAPKEERKRILSTSGRLERRIYEAAWGMPVEKRPELSDYFSNRELPSAGWEGYNPNTSMDQVKIKVAQSLGMDLSEMGYYPQQVKEANLVNVSYPNFSQRSRKTSTAMKLKQLLSSQNIKGDVIPVVTPFGGERINLQAGSYR